MKKNLSYRDKLLELASIYKISEVQENNEEVQNTEEENQIESIDLFPELFASRAV